MSEFDVKIDEKISEAQGNPSDQQLGRTVGVKS